MFPTDLDDEQRAHLAHKHPTDLDSGPSSPSSGAPTFFESQRRPKSASRHRSHTTTDASTSSSHLLARLVSREEEVRELNAAIVVSSERLEAESSRANAAERRALDYFHRLRIATENRERAEQDSARLREELKLYKLQLENAQKEIFRAQDIIDQVASQRNEAEAEAAKARTKARKLQEEKLVMLAREEGRRMGYREGLSIGRRIGYDEGRGRRLTGPSDRLPPYPLSLEDPDGDENVHEHEDTTTDEERNDPRSFGRLRSVASFRQQPMRSESAPPIRSPDTAVHVPPLPIRVYTPSNEHRTPPPIHEPDEPETIHPIPIRPSPIMSSQRVDTPPDGWIPRADSRTSYIHMPPPHGLQQPVPSSPSSAATEIQDSRPMQPPPPTPVPPPIRARDYAYQVSVPAPIQPVRTSSLTSRTSTHISQYDLVNKRPGSSLRHEIYIGRPRSGSQPSRESTSRNEHRDRERRLSERTEAESIVEQWRADSDIATPPNPPRSLTPGAGHHPRRPANFYYRPQTATPLGDVDAGARSRTPVQGGSTATPPPLDDGASHFARTRSPFEYLRQRFRQRPSSGSTIPNIVVESPSEPETQMSPTTTLAGQPDLLSPEAANRPLPQDDTQQQQQSSQSQSQSQSQSRDHHDHHHHHHHHHDHRTPSSTYDTVQRSWTPTPAPSAWPAGFVPYPPGRTESSKSSTKRDREREGQQQRRAHLYADPPSNPYATSGRSQQQHARTSSRSGTNAAYYAPHASSSSASPSPSPAPGQTRGHAQGYAPDGYARARTRSYETAPLPPGMTYPAPPTRPQTSHRHHRDKDREVAHDRERNRGADRERDRDRDRERVRDRDRDRDRDRRRDPGRDHQRDRDRDRGRGREQDLDDTELDEALTRSPAPLARPISLFDSDEA